jgi:hypothetical protein
MPGINAPATLSSIVGLVAYGPVYFDGDYSLLQVTAYSEMPGQTVSGARLRVIADPATFSGTINYHDPTAEQVTVVTGADGVANLTHETRSLPALCTENPARGEADQARGTPATDTSRRPPTRPGDPEHTAPSLIPWRRKSTQESRETHLPDLSLRVTGQFSGLQGRHQNSRLMSLLTDSRASCTLNVARRRLNRIDPDLEQSKSAVLSFTEEFTLL